MSPDCGRRGIEWRWELAPGQFTVHIDVQQMEQVLVNIIKNSLEAIDENGAITIQTSTAPSRMLRIIDTGRESLRSNGSSCLHRFSAPSATARESGSP